MLHAYMFIQIVSGIEYCHYHKIVHRDLKPEVKLTLYLNIHLLYTYTPMSTVHILYTVRILILHIHIYSYTYIL